MARSSKKKRVLFLDSGSVARGQGAKSAFDRIAELFGLGWESEARSLSSGDASEQVTPDDLDEADWVVLMNGAELRPRFERLFSEHTPAPEEWEVPDGSESPDLIEREVEDLVARLIGGGTSRQPRPPEQPTTEATQPSPEKPKKRLTARVGRETKGRRGKGVTTVFDLDLDNDELSELGATLKQKCGTGGTVKDGRIEIQGDQRKRLVALLEEMGYRVKLSGG